MKKIPTGIKGLDEMLRGGLPEGRIILVHGGPGSSKTVARADEDGSAQGGLPWVLLDPLRRRLCRCSNFKPLSPLVGAVLGAP